MGKDEFIQNEIEAFFAEKNYSDTTLETYESYLRRFLEWVRDSRLKIENLELQTVKAWLKGRGYSSSTQHQISVVVKQYVAWRYGSFHPIMKLHVKRIDAGPQRTLNAAQARTLLDSLQPDGHDRGRDRARYTRNRAMVALMIDTGLRSIEVCRLSVDLLNLKERNARVMGKGNKWKTVVFSDVTAAYLREWLECREPLAKPGVRSVFVSVHNPIGLPMTGDGLRAIFRKMGANSGIGNLSPHDLRRTMATLSIRNGASTRLVQVQGGWSDIKLVQRYSQALTAEDFARYSPIGTLTQEGVKDGKPIKG